jgi:hypothetical protein
VPLRVGVQVKVLEFEVVHPGGRPAQTYPQLEDTPDPPETTAVRVSAWLRSIAVAVGVIFTSSGGLTGLYVREREDEATGLSPRGERESPIRSTIETSSEAARTTLR